MTNGFFVTGKPLHIQIMYGEILEVLMLKVVCGADQSKASKVLTAAMSVGNQVPESLEAVEQTV